MSNGTLSALLHTLRRAGAPADESDAHLLQRFQARRDEEGIVAITLFGDPALAKTFTPKP